MSYKELDIAGKELYKWLINFFSEVKLSQNDEFVSLNSLIRAADNAKLLMFDIRFDISILMDMLELLYSDNLIDYDDTIEDINKIHINILFNPKELGIN